MHKQGASFLLARREYPRHNIRLDGKSFNHDAIKGSVFMVSTQTQQIPSKKNKGGRPQKSLESLLANNELPQNWKEIIISNAIKGCSETEIRAAIIISSGKGTKSILRMWNALQERETEFRKAIIVSRTLCEAWWLEQGRKSLKKKNFQSFVWFKNMCNRFGWRDKGEVEHSGDLTFETNEILKKYGATSVRDFRERIQEAINN